MTKKIKIISLFACAIVLVIVLAIALTACKPKVSTYYVSLESRDWETYKSKKDVPDELQFKQDADDASVYTLEVSFNKGEQFVINKIGSKNKIGVDSLFSTENNIVTGENNSFKVVDDGKYNLRLDTSTNTVTYSFMPNKAAKSVTLVSTVSTLDIGDVFPFAAEVVYSDGSKDNNVTWSSSNQSVATVSDSGVVTAISEGSVVITATAGEMTDSVTVTVRHVEVPVTGVSLDKSDLLLDMGESVKLIAKVQPEKADMKDVFWTSNDEGIATVSGDGVVKAVGYGSTIVTVTTANGGFTADCKVTVVKHATALKLSASNITVVAEGAAKTLEISFAPADTTDRSYKYQVTKGNELISVLDNGGSLTISGLDVGEATVVVTSLDNTALEARCEVTIVSKGSIVANMPQNLRVMINEPTSLTVSLEQDAEIQSVVWSVENESVAKLSGSGATVSVTGVDFGSTVVTARVTDLLGAVHTVTCNILVADEFYFIYGYGLGGGDWVYESYLTNQNAAKTAEILLDEQARGIYSLTRYLTPDNGFQIIFPNVASFTDSATTKWNKNIPSELVASSVYFDSTRSDSALISNKMDQFCVKYAGVYTVTLDLTGASAKVYITSVSVDVNSVSLSLRSGSALLRNGDSVTLAISCEPKYATFAEKDVSIWLSSAFSGYANFVSYKLDFASKTLTLTVVADPTSDFTLTVNCAINGVDGSFELIIYPTGKAETPVSSISFDNEEYAFNVNNGGAAWAQKVKAAVNANATVQGVKYSIVESASYFTVDADTGVVTATRLGTVTVRATAVGDESKTATCKVTFYSDTFYLSGEFNDSTSFDFLAQSITDVKGTAFEKYAFTMVSPTYFTLEVELDALKKVGSREEYGFQIIHLGINEQWTSALTDGLRNYLGCYNADTYFSVHDRNVRVLVSGTYIIEIDLSGTSAKWTINWKETDLQDILLTAKNTELNKGESTQIKFAFAPNFATRPENEIVWNVTSGSEYVFITFDYTTLICTVTVINVEFYSDASATVTCTVGQFTKSVSFVIVAQHHLELTWDDEQHWYKCTDAGCDYTEGRTNHVKTSEYVATDPRGHYLTCEDCGVEFGFEEHSHVHSANYWANGSEVCDICGFAFFTIEGNTLVRYSGRFALVNLPEHITEIGANAFEGRSELIDIALPSNLTTIGSAAFKDCSGLQFVLLPDSLTSIKRSAFSGVSAVIMWGKNPTIQSLAGFDGYLGLSFEIPASVRTLESYAFLGSNLVSIEIPDTVWSIRGTVFMDCKLLTSVVFGTGVRSLGQGDTFTNCSALEFVYFKNPEFQLINMGTFKGCTSLKAVYFARDYSTIKNMVTFIYNDEFLKGHCYAYASSNPGTNVDFGKWSDYFVGTWHFDSTGEQTFEHIVIWNAEPTTVNYVLYVSKRKEY